MPAEAGFARRGGNRDPLRLRESAKDLLQVLTYTSCGLRQSLVLGFFMVRILAIATLMSSGRSIGMVCPRRLLDNSETDSKGAPPTLL